MPRDRPNIWADNDPLFTRFQIYPLAGQAENPFEIRDANENLLWSIGPTGLIDEPPRRFSVSRFGAAGDGVSDDTAEIQAAIDAAAAAGGGTVAFDPKTYLCLGLVGRDRVSFSGRGATLKKNGGGTITHNCQTTPSVVRVTGSVAGEFASVTAISSTTFAVALRKHDGSTGTSQTVYWEANV